MVSEFHAPHGVEQLQNGNQAFDLHLMDAKIIKNYSIHTENSLPNAKETPVKQFDTTEVKNTALNTIVSKVETLERALFDKAEAIRKVEALHTQKIADASIALDRVLMEALQSGLDLDDYDLYIPEHADALQPRVAQLIELTALANVEASV
jgi:hypothetical protein